MYLGDRRQLAASCRKRIGDMAIRSIRIPGDNAMLAIVKGTASTARQRDMRRMTKQGRYLIAFSEPVLACDFYDSLHSASRSQSNDSLLLQCIENHARTTLLRDSVRIEIAIR